MLQTAATPEGRPETNLLHLYSGGGLTNLTISNYSMGTGLATTKTEEKACGGKT